MSSSLTRNKMDSILNIEDQQVIEGPFTFQVLNVEQKQTKNNSISIFCVSDGYYKSGQVFLTNVVVKEKSIVELRTIKRNKNYYSVKGVNVINDNETKVIGNPKPIEQKEKENNNNVNTNNNHNNKNNQGNQDKSKVNINVNKEEDSTFNFYTSFHDIDSFSENFCLCLRVLEKSIKSYISKKTGNKEDYVKFLFIDHKGTEVDIVAFGKVYEYIHDKFEEGKIYEVSKVEPKMNENRRGNNSPNFIFNFTPKSNVTELVNKNALKQMPSMSSINLVDLSNLNKYQRYDEIDCMVLITSKGQLENKTFKNGNNSYLMKLKVASVTKIECELAIFGDLATFIQSEGIDVDSIVCFKRVGVGEFNGTKTLSNSKSTQLITDINVLKDINQEIYDALDELRNSGKSGIEKIERTGQTNTNPIYDEAAYISIKDLKIYSENRYREDINVKLNVYRVKGIAFIPNDVNSWYYEGCPNQDCFKKKLLNDGNLFKCPKCNKIIDKPEFQYNLKFIIHEITGQHDISVIGYGANGLFGMNVQEMVSQLNKEVDPDTFYQRLRKQVNFKNFTFYIRPQPNVVNDKVYVRFNVLRVTSINKEIKKESQFLINNITKMIPS